MRKMLLALLAIIAAAQGFAQVRPVTGRVVDDKGNAVPLASVIIRGTTSGVSADANGNFRINAKTGDVLVVSSINFTNAEVSVGSTSEIGNVILASSTGSISEVVVTTALGVRRQSKELGYAATSVTGKDLIQAKSVNIAQALNGKVSGLNISTTNSGVFENAKINIRGIRSLTGNNQPMLVVDGAPTPLGYLSSISPDDVQDLTVLKSGASAAIYGPDAVNGVIVVTTKKGTSTPSVTLTSTVQAQNVSYFPELQHSFGAWGGEGAPYIDQYGNPLNVPYENQMFGPAFDGSIKQIGRVLEDGTFQSGPYSNLHKDDKRKFWNTGLTLQNQVAISGQDYYVGIQDANIKGLIPDDKNRRTSFRFNGSKTYGRFSMNYSLNYIYNKFDVVNEAGIASRFASAYNGGLFFLIMQIPDNVPLLDYKDWRNNKFAQYSNYFNDFAINPYWAIGNIRQSGREDDLLGTISASYQVADWLKATAQVSTSLSFNNFKNSTAPIFVTDWARKNRSSTDYQNLPGNVFDASSFSSRINLDYYLSGDHHFGAFDLKYLAGSTVRQNNFKQVGVGGNNLVVPYLYNVSVRSGDANVPAGNNFDQSSNLVAAYGTLGLSYKGWATVEVTGRNDWDSRLLPQNRSFFYPAVNAALVLTDAFPSLRTNTLSYLKVRGALSKSGNVNLNPYSLQATFSQPGGFPYGNVAGYTANQTIPNPDLQPEFVNTKEVGVEFGFLHNRIGLEATYYFQNNTNQILSVQQSSTTGYTLGLANAASFNNQGVEVDLNLNPLVNIGRGRINLHIVATYNDNKITSTLGNIPVSLTGTGNFTQVASGSPTANNIGVVGGPAFQFQLSDYLRDTVKGSPTYGRVIVDPNTGLPSQNPNLITTGRSLPLWILGFTPSYQIGNFSIGMTWEYKGGNDFYSGLGSDEDFAGISARSAEYGRRRFVFPNSVYYNPAGKLVPNTNIQVNSGNSDFWANGPTNSAIATNYFASAAAWRLRELNISYNLPIRWFGNGRVIKRFTVSAVGKNLLLFVPKANQWGDPEFNYSSTGNTFGLASSFQSPAARLFGGSISVQF